MGVNRHGSHKKKLIMILLTKSLKKIAAKIFGFITHSTIMFADLFFHSKLQKNLHLNQIFAETTAKNCSELCEIKSNYFNLNKKIFFFFFQISK
jgi:hypothetical protein